MTSMRRLHAHPAKSPMRPATRRERSKLAKPNSKKSNPRNAVPLFDAQEAQILGGVSSYLEGAW